MKCFADCHRDPRASGCNPMVISNEIWHALHAAVKRTYRRVSPHTIAWRAVGRFPRSREDTEMNTFSLAASSSQSHRSSFPLIRGIK
jgi:hypothetical protein